MAKDKRIPLELLAPAKNIEIGKQAILHGADAVYIGASNHGARVAAGNSVSDIKELVTFAHAYNARVYVTVNTIVYDSELSEVKQLIEDLYHIGVDALIVQDMGILKLDIPPIALHASTQCDIQNVDKAKFLSSVGFSQLVLARELSLKEINEIHKAVDIPLEAFVHGALCVCYSGDCQAGFMAMGRSANRGECPQICRLAYDLTDGLGNIVITNKHLLSLKDMNRLDYLSQMIEAGVSSFKIEGRLKDVSYVKNVVSVYRRALDTIIAENSEKYRRASLGISEYSFTPQLENSFNRGFTSYFLTNTRQNGIASFDTPKYIGKQIGKVVSCRGNTIVINACEELHNGDGLGYFNENDVFTGFRVNKVEGNRLILRTPVIIKPGTLIYRNKNVKAQVELSGNTAVRYIPVNATLRIVGTDRIALDITIINTSISASSVLTVNLDKAKTPQEDARLRVISKLGDTVYKLYSLEDNLGDVFVPASVLTALRRQTVDAINAARTAAYSYDYRHKAMDNVSLFNNGIITRHDNVANRLAKNFYLEHGAEKIDYAIEVSDMSSEKEVRVMKTRYCLRRELGVCMRTPDAKKLVAPLFLTTGNLKYRLDFDCKNCQMMVISVKQ